MLEDESGGLCGPSLVLMHLSPATSSFSVPLLGELRVERNSHFLILFSW